MHDRLIDKLRTDRFTAMSPRMAAIVGYILDERFGRWRAVANLADELDVGAAEGARERLRGARVAPERA
jgi:hypothetical protein